MQDAILVIRIQRSLYLEVCNMDFGCGIEIDITLYTADAPKVLTFQIIGIRETVYLNGNHILAFFNHGGNVEAGRSFGILAHTYKLAIHVIESSTAHTVCTEEDFFSIPVITYDEIAAIRTCRIPLFGYIRWIRLVPIRFVTLRTELVRLVDVDRSTEALQLPVTRHIDVRPTVHISTHIHEVCGAVGKVFHIVELPFPVEG